MRYNRKGFHGSESHTRFYVACIVFALEHLHDRNIIYRDLKPENLVLDNRGYVKIVDMGLAKFVIGKTYTTCGTPDYFAPELITCSGQTNAIDWWALGILVFELMAGYTPFEASDPVRIYSRIMKGLERVSFPSACMGDVGPFIMSLCRTEPSERLPMCKGGVNNIKDHNWYKSVQFDWKGLEKLEFADVPYRPTVTSKTDLQNFNPRRDDVPRQLEYVDDGSGWEARFPT